MTQEHESAAAHGTDDAGLWARSTAPQSRYGARQVGIGILVLAVGLFVTFGLALALT